MVAVGGPCCAGMTVTRKKKESSAWEGRDFSRAVNAAKQTGLSPRGKPHMLTADYHTSLATSLMTRTTSMATQPIAA